MKSRTSREFWKLYHDLPQRIQIVAVRKYRLWQADPAHPSLQFKKVGKVWSVRITDDYRVLGYMVDDAMIWFFIGSHADYDKFLDRNS